MHYCFAARDWDYRKGVLYRLEHHFRLKQTFLSLPLFILLLLREVFRLQQRRSAFSFHGLETLSRLSRFYRDSDSADHSSRRIFWLFTALCQLCRVPASFVRVKGAYARQRDCDFRWQGCAKCTFYVFVHCNKKESLLRDNTRCKPRYLHYLDFL